MSFGPNQRSRPLTYQERNLGFTAQAAVSYSAVVQLYHQGTNLDGGAGVGPDGNSCLFENTCSNPSANDDAPATLTFTVTVLGGSESECSDGVDNDGDGAFDCADSAIAIATSIRPASTSAAAPAETRTPTRCVCSQAA
jgi:hypothetical protein